MAEKHFTRAEIKRIIRAASQMQQDAVQSDNLPEAGLSLSELEESGAEAGLDPKYIRLAAGNLSEKAALHTSYTNETHNFVERIVPQELPAEAWGSLVAHFRQHFGTTYGKHHEDKKRMECSFKSSSGIETIMNLTYLGEQTKIRLSQRVGLGGTTTESVAYGLVTASILFGIVVSQFDLSSSLTNIGLFAALWLITGYLIYVLDSSWRRSKHRRLNELGDRLVEELKQSSFIDEKKKFKLETDIADQYNDKKMPNKLNHS